jgi:hypothetical protein
LLDMLVEPGLSCAIRRLLEEPQPLVDALAPFPSTLVHGDVRRANLGLTDGTNPYRLGDDNHGIGFLTAARPRATTFHCQ